MDGQPRSRNLDPIRMENINPLHFEALECIHHAVGDAYQCSDCQKTFSNTNDLLVYMTSHTEEKPFHSSHYEKDFSNKDTYMQHMNSIKLMWYIE